MQQYNKLPSFILKSNARVHLTQNLGTGIGAFLLHILCLMPVVYITSIIEATALNKVVLIFIANVVVDIVSSILTAGENYIALCMSASQGCGVMDMFKSVKDNLLKIVGIRIIPAVVKTCAYIPFMLAYRNFQDLAQSYDMDLLMTSYVAGDVDKVMEMLEPVIPMEMMLLGYGILYLIVSEAIVIMFSQTLFILHDYQDKTAKDIIVDGLKIMKGQVGRYFYIQCSFILWDLMTFLTCGLSTIWVYPYKRVTYSELYLDIMRGYNGTRN